MTTSIRIEPETGVALATCSGALGLIDAKEGASALWNDPRWNGKSVVWDFRTATLDVSTPEVREIALFILKHQPSTPPAKVAFVTTQDVDFGLIRMFGALRDRPPTEVRVFRDYDEAVSWARPAGTYAD